MEVGVISEQVESALGLVGVSGHKIMLGESNIRHMKSKHPDDYKKYGDSIPLILHAPDYVRLNPKDASIEYVKEFKVDNDFVKVAVRISTSGTYFARSIYILNRNRVKNYIESGNLISL